MTTKDEGLIRSIKDITAGSVGGIAQVLTGQPFDIVKVCHCPMTPTKTVGSTSNSTILRPTGICGGNRLRQEDSCKRGSVRVLQRYCYASCWCGGLCQHPIRNIRIHETIFPDEE